MYHNNPRMNSEGYNDPTAYAAIKNADREYDRVKKVLKAIFVVCELAGFDVEGRVALRDKRTGKVWK